MRQDDEQYKDLMKLPVKARAELAAKLLRSLDEEPEDESEYEQAWSDEIAHRLRDVDSGTVKLLSEEEAFRLIDSDDPIPER